MSEEKEVIYIFSEKTALLILELLNGISIGTVPNPLERKAAAILVASIRRMGPVRV